MNGGSKLQALRKTLEVEEERVLAVRGEIVRVSSERRTIVSRLEARCQGLRDDLSLSRTRHRAEALCQGNARGLVILQSFQGRIERELSLVEEELRQRMVEAKAAEERLEVIEQELLAVRLEKKRVERLLERKEQTERERSEALEEIATDEMSRYRVFSKSGENF